MKLPSSLTLTVISLLLLQGQQTLSADSEARFRIFGPEPEEFSFLEPRHAWKKSGILTTASVHRSSLVPGDYRENEVQFSLSDGTRMGAFLFQHSESQMALPLVIGSFGGASDRWSPAAYSFIRDYVLPRDKSQKLKAHVLILDHETSAGFFHLNQSLSLGAADGGRHIREVSRLARQLSQLKGKVSSVLLVGVSMGGTNVVHALAQQDGRLGQDIDAALAFSPATHMSGAPGFQIASLGGSDNPFGSGFGGATSLPKSQIFIELAKHFKKTYMKLAHVDLANDLARGSAMGNFFYTQFENRLKQLREERRKLGRHEYALPESVSLGNFEEWSSSQDLPDLMPRIRTPLLMIHAHDDPVIPIEDFYKTQARAYRNPHIQTRVFPEGGHWGFGAAYGVPWIRSILEEGLRVAEARALAKGPKFRLTR